MTTVVSAKDLSLTFQTNDGPVNALSNVTLDIAKGGFVSFIGPSGCGKTTFLRAIAELEHPTSGTLSINGMTPRQARENGPMAMCFRRRRFTHGALSSRTLPCRSKSWAIPKPSSRRGSPHARTGQSGWLRQQASMALSGGMQQRASIARALAFDADLLLMDEPFGALDRIVRDHLNTELLKLWAATEKTICFVTHSIPEAVYLSTKIVVMSPRPGRVTDIIDSTLPRERPLDIRETPEFLAIAARVRDGLRAGHSYEE